jgi:hypothetical protein
VEPLTSAEFNAILQAVSLRRDNLEVEMAYHPEGKVPARLRREYSALNDGWDKIKRFHPRHLKKIREST